MTTKIPKALFTTAIVLALSSASLAQASPGQLLQDLERERAQLLVALLDPGRDATARQSQLDSSAPRLADMERVVLRDEALLRDPTALVRQALNQYDLTFLVHASVEHERSLLDHWLTEVGLHREAILTARAGRRL